ncbi:hypothetical protein EVJ58_g10010 [Rhodofomes roseus]|uniref:Uncharacterized protein n=1 Tax=Rhodofomes roseus TaxID=34475 RepID=A0A4Y9XQU0_9APHY|nr:hypothetical protein EVJ58_g10010 [Rhodofomes roseus]
MPSSHAMPELELPNQDVKYALVGYAQEMYKYTLDLWLAAKKRTPQHADGHASSDDDSDESESTLNTPPVPTVPSISASA